MATVNMPAKQWMTFPALDLLPGFSHRFTLRHPDIDVNDERELVIHRLRDWHLDQVSTMGFKRESLCTTQQVHGTQVSIIAPGSPDSMLSACDGMVTNLSDIVLGIYVADCCAVYLADPATGAFGIVHSGKKGTEGRITANAVEAMTRHFGSDPSNVVVQLSPCIRPPAYEIDFAADIRQQALEAGIRPENLHDSGVCTSSDLTKFYSYRMEKGRTGRMLAILGRSQ